MKSKVGALLVIAVLLGVFGVGLSVKPASAATVKQLVIHCTSYTNNEDGTFIHISGVNQYGTVVGFDGSWSGSNYLWIQNWWWQGHPDGQQVNILIRKHPTDSWMNRGYFYPDGSQTPPAGITGAFWAKIDIVC